MTEYLTCAQTAKLVRAALRKGFPGVKFSVRSDTYAGGASIHVKWTDGPQAGAVDEAVSPYAGSTFDGMTDMKTSRQAWLSPDGTAVRAGGEAPQGARPVQFMADYVFTERQFSPAYRASLEDAVVFLSGQSGPFDGNRRYSFGIVPEGEFSGRAYEDYGSTLVWQLSQAGPDVLASALAGEAKRRAAAAVKAFNAAAAEPKTGYYVTVQDAGRTGALLGPYAAREAAEAGVTAGKRLAEAVNDRAIWYAYGVTKVTMKAGADLPAGKLESLTERQMALAKDARPAMAEAA